MTMLRYDRLGWATIGLIEDHVVDQADLFSLVVGTRGLIADQIGRRP